MIETRLKPQKLLLFCRYGLSNCLFAATYDEILDECRCVPFFHTLAFQDYPNICSGVSLLCMNKILRLGSCSSYCNTLEIVYRVTGYRVALQR